MKDSERSSLTPITDQSVQEAGLARLAPVDARQKSEPAESNEQRSWQEIMDARRQEAIDRKLQRAMPAQEQKVSASIQATYWGLGIGLLIAIIGVLAQSASCSQSDPFSYCGSDAQMLDLALGFAANFVVFGIV